MGEQVDNNRIAGNAIALTLRMILVTIVGLYTSRVVLSVLGDSDYGIWGVVGGVVAMASFLNTAMAGATSRFITFALGKNDIEKVRDTFSTALLVHIVIAAVVTVLAETLGLWFVNNKMNFPPDRMFAVNVLYQLTIISMIVSFTQVPYGAEIIAHEKMKVYAYMESVAVVLKLGIVYMLLLTDSDRLIFYAVLMCLLNILLALTYRMYCVRKFPEARFKWKWNRQVFGEMARFSVYDLYGHMGVIAQEQGTPILLNMFFGVLANTAFTLSFTVRTSILGFTNAVSQAFRPQIIKQYAGEDYSSMGRLMSRSVQFTMLVYALVAVPLMIETPRVMWLWLGQIPEFSVDFIRLSLIVAFAHVIIGVNNTGVHATGNVRNISFISGSFYLISPVVAYVLLRWFDWGVNTVYQIEIISVACVILLGWYFVKIQIPELPVGHYILTNIRTWIAIGASGAVIWMMVSYGLIAPQMEIHHTYLRNLWFVVETTLACVTVISIFAFIIAFGPAERHFILNKILRRKL